jgi:hypothetical protein
MAANKRRGLHPLLDHHDCLAANAELGEMLAHSESLTADDRTYMGELRAALKRYLDYCPPNSIQPTPSNQLSYLIEFVRPDDTVGTIAAALGIPHLQSIYDGFRDLNAAEKQKLLEYFGVSADAFDGPPDD